MEETSVLQKNPDIVTRLIDDETILMPIYKTSDEINCIYSLNPSASAVWNLIDGKRSLFELKEEIMKKFDTSPAEMEQEMRDLLKDFTEIGAVSF